MKKENLIWAAGLFCGEGCVRSTDKVHMLELDQLDHTAGSRLFATLGGNFRPTGSGMWRWDIGGKGATKVAKRLLPYAQGTNKGSQLALFARIPALTERATRRLRKGIQELKHGT